MTVSFTTHSLATRLISSALFLVVVSNIAKTQCPGLGSITFNVVAEPEPTLAFPTSICDGQSATIAVNETFNSYLWSTGSTSSSITVTQGGSYTVTVTNLAGCDATASASVVVNTNPQPTITGPTTICQNNPIVLSATGGFADWAWSNGGSTPSITVSTGGNYAVTVTDANGCTGTANIVVTESNANVQPDITSQPLTCGQVTLNAGTGFASYNWSTGGNTQTINVQQNGNYSVTVTDAFGCTGTDEISVSIPLPTFVDLIGPASFCSGGTATLTASPGFNNYFWSDGTTGVSTITITQPGQYSVTASDANGCLSADGIFITASGINPPQIVGNTVICSGGSTVLSLTENYPNILWSSGQTTQQISVTSVGTYTVTVTDVNGCTASNSTTISPGGPINFPFTALPAGCGQFTLEAGPGYASYLWSTGSAAQSITVNQNGPYSVTVTDAGGCTGSVSLTVIIPPPTSVQVTGGLSFCPGGSTTLTASPGFVAYAWSNGANSSTNTVNQPGGYTVTATDGSGCTSTATANVAALPAPIPTVTQPAPICPGEIATLAVTNPIFQSYNWSNGGTGSSITVSSAGIYTVTVTDANGCTGTATTSLTVNPGPVVVASQLPYQCNGQAELSATPGFSTYAWSNGGNTSSITVSQPGSYTVTVTNANGCTSTANVNASIPPVPEVSITGDPTTCEGTNTTLSATPGFANYFWSTGQNGPNISVAASGTYFVTATDGFTCTATSAFNVTVQPAPTPQITGPTQICSGGTAVFTAIGGAFTAYNWSNGSQAAVISVGAPGVYSLTVTDANGCTGTASVALTVGNSLDIALTELPYQCNGEITLDAGAGFQSYNWSNGSGTQFVTVSSNGNFSVTVTDATGCTGSATTSVSIPAQPQVSISGPTQICDGENTELVASTGLASYLWNNGQQNPSIFATATGTYSVTATDANGCQATASFTLTVNPIPQPTITGVATICPNSSTLLSAAGNFLAWTWSTGQTAPQISASSAGTYTVTVTDATGCTGADAFQLSLSPSLQPQIIALSDACNGQVNLDAGPGYQTYAWSNGGAAQTVIVSQNGSYTVTVSDADGCTGTAVVNTTIPPQQQVSITGDTIVCSGGSNVLTASTGFQTYLWSNGTAAAETTVTQSGTYTVTATDAIGCTAMAAISINVSNLITPEILGSTTICNGASTLLTLSQIYTDVLWSTGETTQQITAATAGTYSVTVSDLAGCTGATSVTVTTSSSLSPQIALSPITCGLVGLDAGPGFASYAWSDGSNAQTTAVSQNGSFTVTVSDTGGCTGTATITVTLPIPVQVAISGDQSICTGGSSTLTATAGFVSYFWSNGANSQATTISLPGLYSVTATDVNGCNTVAGISVTAGNLPLPEILGSTTICNGASTLLTLSQIYTDVLWSTGETTQQITAPTAGTYSVTVSDLVGCTGATSVTVTTSSSLSPQIALSPITCGLVGLDAGPGFASYAWSDGTNAQTTAVSQNGDYTVTVSDAGGCTGTAVITVALPTPVQVAISGDQIICTGGSSTLTATAGFVSYFWSNGDDSPATTISQPGLYSVTATDVNGCNTVAAFTVVEDFILPPQILGSSIICNGNPTTIGLSASYDNYLWSNGSTGSFITVATPGLVSVTVTNVNGCSGEASIAITAGNNINPQVVQVSNDCSGLVGLGVGNAYTSYLWSNGSTNQITLVDQTGIYTVTVTDANGCSGVGSIFAQVPQQFSVSISGNTAFCPGGSSTLTATGGFQDYIWSNGAIGTEITVAQAGNYAVTVSDINGCTGTAQVTVTVGSGTPPQIVGSNVICVGGSTVLSLANAANFTQFIWSNGSTTPQITATDASVYAVTTTDGSGCTATASIAVTEGNALAPTISESGYNCDGNLTLEAPDGYAGYVWSTGSGTPIITVSQDGSYSLTVTDASGCTGTASIFVQFPDELVVVVQTPPTPICPGSSAQLSVPPGFNSYAWNTGETSNSILIGSPGNYAVTVTDQYGCTAFDEYAFNFAQAPDFGIIGDQLDCESAEAVLEIDLVDAIGSPSFLWSNGATTATLVTAQPGVFSITVTDGNGCTATQSTEVLPQESFFSSFADTIEFVPGQVVSLVPPSLDFQPVGIAWSPTEILVGCDNCPTAQARPIEDELVTYTAVSEAGCILEGTFFLFFKDRIRPSVYAPNAFSPDSPYNPAFTLFGNELVVEIKYLRIFTRWGEMIVELKNLALNDPSKGWDGSFRGELVDPGVFVWVAEVVYENGTTEVLKGDVTVVR